MERVGFSLVAILDSYKTSISLSNMKKKHFVLVCFFCRILENIPEKIEKNTSIVFEFMWCLSVTKQCEGLADGQTSDGLFECEGGLTTVSPYKQSQKKRKNQ